MNVNVSGPLDEAEQFEAIIVKAESGTGGRITRVPTGFIPGVLPLVLASGAGANARKSIGITVLSRVGCHLQAPIVVAPSSQRVGTAPNR